MRVCVRMRLCRVPEEKRYLRYFLSLLSSLPLRNQAIPPIHLYRFCLACSTKVEHRVSLPP